VRFAGAYGSEDGGMSNKNQSENLWHRKPKVSWAMLIIPGLVGPKLRLKSVGDGQQVKIPAPATQFVRHDGRSEPTRTYDLSCGAH